MIEKLKKQNTWGECLEKLNEVIDAVNSLRDDCNLLMGYIAPENKCEPADPYAEQRKWIGKLCKVYDDNDFEHYAVLDEIYDDSNYCYGTRLGNYRHCELVKPDDDIIYKKEQQ